jgi:tetratricopeptide (TPR) repeat protein
LRQSDIATAVRRFNQSWLLDADNGAAYWGFAAVVATRDRDLRCAGALFDKAILLLPADADLHVDHSRFLGQIGQYENSILRFLRALELNSKVRDAHRGLTISYARLGNVDAALRHARLAIAQGDVIEPRFVTSLECASKLLASGAAAERVQQECR